MPDVSDILKNFFGESISSLHASNLAERFHELLIACENSGLEAHYKVIYRDAIYITVKRDNSYAKEPIHIIYGVRDDSKRKLLDLSINPTESHHSWSKSIERLKKKMRTEH